MDFSKHIQKADEALRRKNYDFAVELYRQLIDLDPDQGEARGGLRRALRLRQESKTGSKLLRVVSGALPKSRAIALARMGKHEACARALEDYLATNPTDQEANLQLGASLEEAGHFRSARAVYEFAADIAPKNPEALKRAGAMMYRTGEHGRALEYYERALKADPRDQEALKARKNLAAETALERTGADTVAHSRDLIKNKEEARGLERQRKLHLSEDELRAELGVLEERFAETPSDPDLMLSISEVHERLRDVDAALELASRALSYRKDSFELVARVGDLEAKQLKKRVARADRDGRSEEASAIEKELIAAEVENHRRRVELRPADASLRLALAKKLLRADDVEDALVELQRCQGEPRIRGEVFYLLGHCFQKKGILDLAKKDYGEALKVTRGMNERAKDILYNLGAIAEKEGNAEEARSYYIRIYEVDIAYRDVAAKMGAQS